MYIYSLKVCSQSNYWNLLFRNPNQPNPLEEHWQPYDVEHQRYLRVGQKIEATSRMLPMRTALWTEFIPKFIKTLHVAHKQTGSTFLQFPIISAAIG